MPTETFFRLPEARRAPLIDEAIREFAERSYAEASLTQLASRARIPKGSVYQYFADKLDLYRWLLTDEVPRQKRVFLGTHERDGDFWTELEHHVERGMAFLVEHPRLARLTAAAADPAASAEVRGLHRAICRAAHAELRALLEVGVASGALIVRDLDRTTHLVESVLGPGLTELVLAELGASLHDVLRSDALRKKLGPSKRRALARAAVSFLRSGLGVPEVRDGGSEARAARVKKRESKR